MTTRIPVATQVEFRYHFRAAELGGGTGGTEDSVMVSYCQLRVFSGAGRKGSHGAILTFHRLRYPAPYLGFRAADNDHTTPPRVRGGRRPVNGASPTSCGTVLPHLVFGVADVQRQRTRLAYLSSCWASTITIVWQRMRPVQYRGPGWFKLLPCTYATCNIYPTLHPRFIVPGTQGIRVFITAWPEISCSASGLQMDVMTLVITTSYDNPILL
ncbi:hypothetical protein BC826DRAFT_967169 [Russula brevipes]|nr:hypothetical protein BC826DRAFT_967169 [Russula brevipes]